MVRLPVPIEQATKVLATLIQRVDELAEQGKPLEPALIEAFGDAKDDVAQTVDLRQAVAAQLVATIEGTKAYRDEVEDYIDRLEAIQEAMKADALRGLQALPADVEVRGASGKKLYKSASGGKVVYSFDLKKPRTFTNVIDPETVKTLDIPQRYIKGVSALVLDTETVKSDLKAGVELDWAKIEVTEHVRGLFPTPKSKEAEA